MSQNVTVSRNSGIGVAGLLGVLFIALKLTGVIAWSWLWVLAPFWIPLVFALGVAIVVVNVVVLAHAFGRGKKSGW